MIYKIIQQYMLLINHVLFILDNKGVIWTNPKANHKEVGTTIWYNKKEYQRYAEWQEE